MASELHVVALSGGKDSTAMAVRLRQLYPSQPYTYVCTPTGDELPEMFAHWQKLRDTLGGTFLPIVHPRGLNGLIFDDWRLPNWRERWCTRRLKIEPYAAWLMKQSAQHTRIVSYVGIRFDEPEREAGDYLAVPGIEQCFPLRDWEWCLDDVLEFLSKEQIDIPRRTDCARCFYQKLIEWFELWRDHREIYLDAANQEAAIGYTFRSPGRDKWPTSLWDLAARFEAGEIPKDTRQKLSACRVCRL